MSEVTKELLELVWGTKSSPGLSDTIFCRWTQGFVFSESEGSALEQFEGGPCAVIAPVQAFLLKKLLFSSEKSSWRDCSELLGIHEQAAVGFLTLMEALRYCKVGSYLKSPKFPIWIVGSETHLTVFFAKDMALVAPEAPSEQARRVFQTYDPEDNGFIADSLLEDVMKALDLVSDPEYINLMKNKLDPEGLGIILLGPFLQEFFPDQGSSGPESFTVYHYNGLKQSNYNEKVMYVEGTAVVMGFEDPMLQTDDTPIKRCLQTKWPYIELLWTTDRCPSLN
ncbi:ubiquitin carboxyl-terminal hydrolase MINDY-3 isoform X6 [Mus musculus]|nr:ubiquitin carboxyl-terminal hydrolase MINDY-3 isoform X6 [Mus musculus]|eukprot:XP_006497588.1 PREDICTED: protein FAM188A isoform X4 [Mus musculus]